jgi:hypothetical protein
MHRFANVLACLLLTGKLAVAAVSAGMSEADLDWNRRARAPGVVKAVGFDQIREWAQYGHDRGDCNSDYQVRVDGKLAGCRNNAWDASVKSSGAGSVRFDILPRTGQGGGGAMAIPFGDYATSQFGANEEFWLSWRQRMDARYLQAYRREGGGVTTFKQIIISQGDMPIGSGDRVYPANACSEAQIVIVSSNPINAPTYPIGYIECGRYLAFDQTLARGAFIGDPRGSRVATMQNMRRNDKGHFNCIYHPNHLDRSGCVEYAADQWITYMLYMKMGAEGTAVSSVHKGEQPGYVDSTYELYVALPGRDFELLHRQTGLVIPKGQYYIGGDPGVRTSYKSGWGPGDAHPQAKYGKVWLLSYINFKDPQEAVSKASTWFDEIIVSRCRIAAPGQPAPAQCKPPAAEAPSAPANADASAGASANAKAMPSLPPASKITPAGERQLAQVAPVTSPAPALPSASEIPGPEASVPRESKSPLSSLQVAAVLRNLQPGHWFEFPRSEMVRVQVDACKSERLMQEYKAQFGKGFTCNPDHAMAYSGGAYDSKRHRLLVWGGGHSGYGGNEVYAFDVPRAAWVRLTDPSPAVFEYRFDAVTKRLIPNEPPWHDPTSGPAPISAHSYDHLEYLPDQDALFSVSGSVFGPGYPSGLAWMLDLAGNAVWRQGARPPRDRGLLIEHNLVTAYDPMSKRVLLRGYAAAAAYDPRAATWQVTRRNLPTRGLGTVGELDPKRRLFMVLGPDRKEFYEVGPNGEFLAEKKLTTKGAVEIEKCYAPGLAYDSKADRLVAWCGGGDVYSLDAEGGSWTRHANKGKVVPGDPGKTPGIRGTFGRFRYMPEYNAYIVVNGSRNNAFIYRLADDNGRIPD